jgi:hypothetical protein
MDKKINGLVGAVSGLALTAGQTAAALAGISSIQNPTSYSELLEPIPNAGALLRVADAAEASAKGVPSGSDKDPNVKLVYDHHHHHYHHHHHHHHHHYPPWWYYYHHHHHHHYYDHHHHHHHHHRGYDRDEY